MFVTGRFKQHQAEDCHVKIFHKEKDVNNCIQALGKVVWSNDEGIGLEFTSMTFENYILLQTTISNNAEQPEIVLREFPNNYPFEISAI